MIRIIVLISLILIMTNTYTLPREVVDRVIAVVNDDIITLSEFNKFLLELPEESQQIDKYKVLNDLVDQKLLEQEASNLGISVTEEEIDQSISIMQQQLGMTADDMQAMLNKENITDDQLRSQWRMQLLSNKVVSAKLKGNIAVTEDEVRDLYVQYYGEIQNVEEVKIAHILIKYNYDNEQQSLKKAQEVYELAKSGQDFKSLVDKYSEDTLSKDNEGVLGYFKRGELVSELEEVIENTKVGEVSGPIKTPSGYHIVKVLDRKSLDQSSVDNYRDQLKYEIYKEKVAKELEKFIADIRKGAYIEIKL